MGTWVNKLVHLYDGILFGTKKGTTDACNNMDKDQVYYT